MGYNKKDKESDDDDEDSQKEADDSWEAEDVDPGEMGGVEGMIYQSLELLATLVQRPNVQQLIL